MGNQSKLDEELLGHVPSGKESEIARVFLDAWNRLGAVVKFEPTLTLRLTKLVPKTTVYGFPPGGEPGQVYVVASPGEFEWQDPPGVVRGED